MKPTEKMGTSIPHASLDNIIEGDEDLDNIIDMEQGDVSNENLVEISYVECKNNVREGGNPWKGGV